MTKAQKETLQKMRLAGKSYADICRVLGAKESTVRTYCSRNGLTDKDLKQLPPRPAECKTCPNCGKVLEQIPKQKPRRFCSDACRRIWWSKNRELYVHTAYYTVHCVHCGKEFITYGNKKRKYCCHPCYIQDRFGT